MPVLSEPGSYERTPAREATPSGAIYDVDDPQHRRAGFAAHAGFLLADATTTRLDFLVQTEPGTGTVCTSDLEFLVTWSPSSPRWSGFLARIDDRRPEFPATEVGSTAVRVVTIENLSNDPFPFAPEFEVTGLAQDDFIVDAPALVALAPGERADLVLTFAPQAQGVRTALLRIRVGSAVLTVTLEGVGL